MLRGRLRPRGSCRPTACGQPRRSCGTGTPCRAAVAGYASASRAPYLGLELDGVVRRQRGQHRPQAGAAHPLQHRILTGEHLLVGGFPRVGGASGVQHDLQVIGGLAQRPRRGAARRRACRPTGRLGHVAASGCATADVKLPGTCRANHAPGFSASSQPASRSGCPGTHCRAALVTTTSVSADGQPGAMSPSANSSPGADCRCCSAVASISADESRPTTRAEGQRAASVAVRLPGPQPRSTTSPRSVGQDRGRSGQRTGAAGSRRTGRIWRDPTHGLRLFVETWSLKYRPGRASLAPGQPENVAGRAGTKLEGNETR